MLSGLFPNIISACFLLIICILSIIFYFNISRISQKIGYIVLMITGLSGFLISLIYLFFTVYFWWKKDNSPNIYETFLSYDSTFIPGTNSLGVIQDGRGIMYINPQNISSNGLQVRSGAGTDFSQVPMHASSTQAGSTFSQPYYSFIPTVNPQYYERRGVDGLSPFINEDPDVIDTSVISTRK